VRHIVVVFRAKTPVKWASFATPGRPERKFAGSLAVQAVLDELFSKEFPANRENNRHFASARAEQAREAPVLTASSGAVASQQSRLEQGIHAAGTAISRAQNSDFWGSNPLLYWRASELVLRVNLRNC
jgi:hypothetical protein